MNASVLAQTNASKSVLDAGESVWFEEVDERYSTQTCSCCESRSGPAGQASSLGVVGMSLDSADAAALYGTAYPLMGGSDLPASCR